MNLHRQNSYREFVKLTSYFKDIEGANQIRTKDYYVNTDRHICIPNKLNSYKNTLH